MKALLIALMLVAGVVAFATPVEAKGLPMPVADEELHCALPYPVDPCLYDYLDWLLSVRGPINLVYTLLTGDPQPCVEP